MDGTSVYWTNGDGFVMKVPFGGGAPVTLALGPDVSEGYRCRCNLRVLVNNKTEQQRRFGDDVPSRRRDAHPARLGPEPPLEHRSGRDKRLLDGRRERSRCRHGDEGGEAVKAEGRPTNERRHARPGRAG